MNNLKILLNLWRVINSRESFEDEAWSSNDDVLRALDILSSYPNEFWKYPVVIYYLKYRTTENFDKIFLKFIHKLIAELLPKYLETHTINSVKSAILKLNVAIIKENAPAIDFSAFSNDELRKSAKTPHNSAVRMLLKLLAYDKQTELLPSKWEIEHILPQKWQKNFFLSTDDNEVKKTIEHLGNKIPFEKKLNIIAGNGYFSKKKDLYKNSKIEITKSIGNDTSLTDWGLDSIIERNVKVADRVVEILEGWRNDYAGSETQSPQFTEEQLALLEKLKATGVDISSLRM